VARLTTLDLSLLTLILRLCSKRITQGATYMYEWRDDKRHETFWKAGWAVVEMLQACILEYHQLCKAICKKNRQVTWKHTPKLASSASGATTRFEKIIVMLRMEKCRVAGHARHGYTAFRDAWS
jgi:hypothetical protein